MALTGTAWKEAQRAVIGSLLIDPEHVAGLIFSRAKREHFGDAALLHVYDAALALWLDRKPIDAVTVLHEAGDAYEPLIRKCMQQTPTAANVESYLELIRSSSRMSAFRSAALRILDAADEAEAAAIFERMGQMLMDTEDVVDKSWTECVNEYLDRMNTNTRPDYLHFGIQPLDDQLAVSSGKFVIIAADSSVGKTALALQFAHHIASTGKRVGFFSLETDTDTLTNRLMAEVANISLPRSKLHALTSADYMRANTAGEASTRVPLRLINRCDTVEQIRSRTIMQGFDVIFVDYLQIIEAPGDKRWDIVTNISIQLHRMAQRLGVTVIGLSQITPPDKGGSKELTMDDLRESRQLKHDADVILILTPDDTFPNARKLTIAKNKDGKRLNKILLSFDPEHMRFSYSRKKKEAPAPGQHSVFEELGDGKEGDLPF